MGSPIVFSGRRAKLISSRGLLTKAGEAIDNNGPVNMMPNGNCESGVSGWGNFTIAGYTAGTFPTTAFSNGAIQNFSTSNLISGDYSLEYSTGSTWTAGTGLASPQMTTDINQRGKLINISFDYAVTAGSTRLNLSGTSANTFHVVVWDQTNSKYVQPVGTYGITQGSGCGTFNGQFQTDSNTINFNVLLLVANANTSGLTTIVFDNFYVGRVAAPTGAVMTDWKSYTPVITTNSGTMTNYTATGQFRQIGDSYKYKGKVLFTGAAGTWSGLKVGLFSSHTIDTTKINASPVDTILGISSFIDSGATLFAGGIVTYDTTTRVNVAYTVANGATAPVLSFSTSSTGPVSFSTNDFITFEFEVPIVGASSNVQLSSDAGNSQIVMSAYKNAGSITLNTTIPSWTASNDSAGMFNLSTGVCTIPSPGDYDIEFGIGLGAIAQILVNGSIVAATSSTGSRFIKTTQRNLKANDLITFTSDTSGTLNANNYNTIIAVSKKSNPQTIAANDTVASSYWLSANQTTAAQINFDSKEYDYTGAVTTGVGAWRFTASQAGLYSINVFANAASSYSLSLYKNNVKHKFLGVRQGVANVNFNTGTTVRLLAGEYIDVRPNASNTFIGGAIDTDLTSRIEITRIGNY